MYKGVIILVLIYASETESQTAQRYMLRELLFMYMSKVTESLESTEIKL